ncbi:MAG TPA: phenylalanine--tRNA ligase subunit alpha, partial [Bryobacteraceae bacterium]|nr:phenylalanine--tRNA ligase subunit alpha [Bryobacteraceae bacterium]
MLDAKIQSLHAHALEQLASATSLEAVEAIRIEALGRKGKLAELSKELGKLPPDQRGPQGKLLNAAKQDLESKINARQAALEEEALNRRLDSEWIDLTTPAPGIRPGALHPVTQVQQELEQLFASLGFAVVDGPEVETEHYNFDALNIPADHPARDMQDTFWLKDGRLLRTHTSP